MVYTSYMLDFINDFWYSEYELYKNLWCQMKVNGVFILSENNSSLEVF